MKLSHAMLALSLTFATTACGSHMKTPDIKKNPHPKMRYELTMTIKDAPGPFDSIEGHMQYEVSNKTCVPEVGAPANPLRIAPKSWPQVSFKRVADNVYTATIYADYLEDDDYYGLGVCHWSMKAFIAELKTQNLTLGARLLQENLSSDNAVTTYFARQDYLASDVERSSLGENDRSNYKSNLQDQLFSVSLSAREAFQ